MTSKKQEKIKKLKKTRVWPSIMWFLISSGITVLLIFILYAVFFAMTLESKVGDRYQDAQLVSKSIVGRMNEFDAETFLAEYQNVIEDSSALAVCDANGNVLAQSGELSYDLQYVIDLGIRDEYIFYKDKNTMHDLASIEDFGGKEFRVLMKKLFQKDDRKENINISVSAQGVGIFGTGDDLDEVLSTIPYWIRVDLNTESGEYALVKQEVVIFVKEFVIAIIACGIAGVLMLIPAIFLLSNVVGSIKRQRRVTRLLYTDMETGGRNWFGFETEAKKIVLSGKNAKKCYAILDVNLMKYRNYCTYHGMKAGEEFLERVDTFLEKHVGKKELSAHYGKANFAMLLEVNDTKEALVERVNLFLQNNIAGQVSHKECKHDGDSMDAKAIFHVGVFFLEQERDEAGNVKRRRKVDIPKCYNNACAARATIPDEADSTVVCFNQQLLDAQLWEHTVETKMQAALEREEFQVYIQPKYNPVTQELCGGEALIRWISPTEGFIAPGRFIPIFEKNGFITKIDDYMISHTAALQAKWLSEGKRVVPISVNVSRAHFTQADLAEHICALVDAYNLPHEYLEIELTESAFFDDKAALLNTVQKLKGLGFELSMDDFGAGYSSLNSLKDLPLDVLKLDAEFFRGDVDDKRGQIVVSEAIHMAKNLDMRIVAEGVEQKDQVDFLATVGCDMIQGYYFSKPVPVMEFEQKMDMVKASVE